MVNVHTGSFSQLEFFYYPHALVAPLAAIGIECLICHALPLGHPAEIASTDEKWIIIYLLFHDVPRGLRPE